MSNTYKLPRIHVNEPMKLGADLAVSESIHHYLKNVMRLEAGADIRAFNGKDGEFLGKISLIDKKRAVVNLQKLLKKQPSSSRKVHLLFAPIKKERMDWLVEKSVELGVTDLHPVLTQNTDIRKINEEKIQAQMIEAAEQCERMDIPTLHPVTDVWKVLTSWDSGIPILAAIERHEAKSLSSALPKGDVAFLIGPAGGFTDEEKHKLAEIKCVVPVTLGENILRAETAAIAALSSLIV